MRSFRAVILKIKSRRFPGIGEAGQAVVEFALLLPILVALVMGVLDMARAYSVLQMVSNAAREGARVAILPVSTDVDITNTVETTLSDAGQTGCNAAGLNWGENGSEGTSTTVTVSCPFQTLTGNLIPFWTGSFDLEQTVTMRHE